MADEGPVVEDGREPEPGPAVRPKAGMPKWAFAVAGAFAVAALVAAAVLGFVYMRRTPVPDLKGKTVAQATESLAAAGLRLGNVTYDEKQSRKPGLVNGQDPQAGRRVDAGEFVRLTVAGPAPVPVPSVLGLSKAEAESALEAAGLVLGEVTEFHHPQVAAGRVITQEPEAESEAPKGSAVDVAISKGAEPLPVPDVVGDPIAGAEQVLTEAGFKVSTTEVGSSAAKGTVISQSPGGTESAPRGTTIVLTVSSGVTKVRVPNIQGLRPDDADLKLRRAGLLPSPVAIHGPIESDAGDIGRAYRQRPGPGLLVPTGTKVSYHYWWESQ